MSSDENLTAIEKKDNTPSSDDLKLKLEENYYEKLFVEEMKFRTNPNKVLMKSIIQKHCQAVEYFSSIGDDKRATRYKLLNNVFLNDPQLINTLDEQNSNELNIINCSKYKLIKDLLILNQKKNKFNDDNCNNKIKYRFNFKTDKEQEKFDELIKKKNSFENKIESINLINDEIKTQKNNFKKNLTLKLQKKKSMNENKILQGIKNVLIKGKNTENKISNDDEEKIEMINNSEINDSTIEKKISPIKLDQNYSDKETASSNELKFDSNHNYVNPLLSSGNNKKNTSEFEPLTPFNIDKSERNKDTNEFKSSAKQDISIVSEEINETNDFSLCNNDNIYNNNGKEEKCNKSGSGIMFNPEISFNDTKCSYNTRTLSNCSLSNSQNKSLSESNIANSNFLKSFRLDFNDLFDYIREQQNANKKTISFCNDIKTIIEKYINDFNQHLSKNIITKIIRKFSDIWDDMFKKYSDISEFFDKEIKQINIDNINQNKSNISELSNLIDNINIEKENALNQNEEKFISEIENSEHYFKTNYNKIDNGILLLNEKFAYIITKRVYDMINNA